MVCLDFVLAGKQFEQALPLRPSELRTFGCRVFVVDLLLVVNGLLKEIGMLFIESYPLVLSLEKTKETSRSGSPGVIGGEANAGVVENPKDVFLDKAIFLK